MRAAKPRGDRVILLDGPETREKEEAIQALIAERLPDEDPDLTLELHGAGPELGRALLELDKLISHAGGREEISEEDVALLVPGGLEESIFALLNHVAAGNRRQAIESLRRLLESGEPPARILPMIARTL